MRRPLYSNLSRATLQLGSGNAGLWYDKLCDRWSDDWALPADKKLEWIETLTATGKTVGDGPLIEESCARMLRLIQARGGRFGIFETESRFVTGLGRSHPVENGFAWHPTLGVPYLPGSSVKGLVLAWAEREAEPHASRVAEILGSAKAAGRVVFLDAIPVASVQLEADVMTPHYAGWNPDDPPGDWRGPVPVPFLVVAPKNVFAFSLLPARPSDASNLPEVFEWLRAALRDAGAGAKTSVGYGRFRYHESETAAREKALVDERSARAEQARRAEAQRTPDGRWRLELERKSEREILELVRVHLEKQPIVDPAERRAFARAVAATGLPGSWRKGQKRDPATQVGSAKLKERARLVQAEVGDDEAMR